MRILLDENIPRRLKFDFNIDDEVSTVQDMNWQGKKNGELMGLMTLAGFDVFITMDKNLQHQQNIKRFSIQIIILDALDSKYKTLQSLIFKVTKSLNGKISGQILIIS
jgi:predicted nuclease of predicted toxin-antitoxin system